MINFVQCRFVETKFPTNATNWMNKRRRTEMLVTEQIYGTIANGPVLCTHL